MEWVVEWGRSWAVAWGRDTRRSLLDVRVTGAGARLGGRVVETPYSFGLGRGLGCWADAGRREGLGFGKVSAHHAIIQK